MNEAIRSSLYLLLLLLDNIVSSDRVSVVGLIRSIAIRDITLLHYLTINKFEMILLLLVSCLMYISLPSELKEEGRRSRRSSTASGGRRSRLGSECLEMRNILADRIQVRSIHYCCPYRVPTNIKR